MQPIALYARVSTDDQAENGISLEEQEQRIRDRDERRYVFGKMHQLAIGLAVANRRTVRLPR